MEKSKNKPSIFFENNEKSLKKQSDFSEIMEKSLKKSSDLFENSERFSVFSSQLVETKKNYQKPIVFDNENLEKFNNNDKHAKHAFDLKLLRKNLFSREKAPMFQRALTSHQLYRFHLQKNDFMSKNNEINEKNFKNMTSNQIKKKSGVTSTDFFQGYKNFIGDSNFMNINPKFKDSHLNF